MIGEPIAEHADAISAVTLGILDGRAVVVSGSDDGTIYLWDIAAHTRRLVVRVGMPVTYVDFTSKIGLTLGLNTGILTLDIRLDPFEPSH
jgi:hypothetical protein